MKLEKKTNKQGSMLQCLGCKREYTKKPVCQQNKRCLNTYQKALFYMYITASALQKQCSSQQTRQQIPSLTIVLHLDTSFQLSPNLQESERKQCNAMPKNLKVFWPIRRDLPPCVSSCYLLEEEDLPLSIKVGSRLTLASLLTI